ncbi:uncharacterized protein [Argopecten irradians]|uniref:uncharacterized protein n=1 Tax=Argopecten irradians TaxID=31199 RepID=UPI0037146659
MSEIYSTHLIINKDMRLTGATFQEILITGLQQCVRSCMKSQTCKSINYHRETLTCEMNRNASSQLSVSDFAWDYMDKSQFPTVLSNPCHNVVCPALSTCVPLKSGQTTCAVTECNEFILTSPTMTTVTTCNVVGCQITLACENEHVFDTQAPDRDTVTCLPDGSWSPVTSTCVFAGCTSYANTYTVRHNWHFQHPDMDPIYGQTVDSCLATCNSYTQFTCVAFYFNKDSNRCNLQQHRVHDNPDFQQYEVQDNSFDEYIRDCA